MTTDFKNFLAVTEYVSAYGAVFVPENFAWAKEFAKQLPSIDLGLPTIERRAKIDLIMDKKNPIYVQLADGSKLFFTIDEFRRIEGKPERGKTMVVIMQRQPLDRSDLPSQIMKCQIV